MPLMPKRVKHRKMHRGSRSGNATSGTYVAFGDFGLPFFLCFTTQNYAVLF